MIHCRLHLMIFILYFGRTHYVYNETDMRANSVIYETLKFYCNQGLVPNVKRDKNNHRIFDKKDIAWINSLNCLKNCGMSINEMKEYLALCLQGETTIPERKSILKQKRSSLLVQQQQIQDAINYIDWKQGFYDDVLAGKNKYYSNLINNGDFKKA